ncbi:hypothetical protein K435DRAFT_847277 [Dendrothele bispora CBS 962.96]|uniref:ER membrane protein complex subunit 10 n=1 Tax=Dendrothele bispora (strain CBS 962.96) TaxID=1314807 RepID=A0A4S8MZ01_DENBC|nr:hypothetical protein K435DRAFT_847277 [Dendrothele bispora CBS 962.96]
MILLPSLFLFPLAACASSINVYHRILVPNSSQSSFVERGILDSSSSSFQPSSSLSQHFTQFAEALRGSISHGDVDLDRVLYQVALERNNGEWDVSSVKLCHLPFISSETIILHIPDHSTESHPHAIDYFVSPIPHNGLCPRSSSKALEFSVSALTTFSKNLAGLNTTVSLTPAELPPLPQLRTPPPLTPAGEPVQPVPEKSFLQKYWMYIAALMIALLLSGGAPEEEQQSGQK